MNTDGIDVKGKDIWIHHCTIVNDDDSITIKPSDTTNMFSSCSENILISDTTMTGFGASVGMKK